MIILRTKDLKKFKSQKKSVFHFICLTILIRQKPITLLQRKNYLQRGKRVSTWAKDFPENSLKIYKIKIITPLMLLLIIMLLVISKKEKSAIQSISAKYWVGSKLFQNNCFQNNSKVLFKIKTQKKLNNKTTIKINTRLQMSQKSMKSFSLISRSSNASSMWKKKEKHKTEDHFELVWKIRDQNKFP